MNSARRSLSRYFSRTLGAALVLTLVGTALAACSLPSQASVNCEFPQGSKASNEFANDVSIVLAPTSNFVNFDKVIDASQVMVDAAFGVKGARVSIVLADGKPSLVRSLPPETGDTEEDAHIINRHALGKLHDVYYCTAGDDSHKTSSKIPLNPESDMLAALNVAAGSFDPTHPEAERHILVLGNGLQTTGQYLFNKTGVPRESDVGTLVGALKSQGALPDLTGATVDFIGLGVVNADQPVLNQQSLDGIVAFWMAVVAASGGHVGTVLAEVIDGKPSAGSIPVAAVESLTNACIDATVAEADGISFRPSTAEFLDPAAASATATALASKIAESGCHGDITVTGFVTAAVSQSEFVFGNPEDQVLSLARAEAFKQLLIGAGVISTIITVGGGKGPVNEWDANGNYVEELGKQNRKVVVTQ